MFNRLLQAAENGLIPDALVRVGIRRMLRARQREIESGGKRSIDDFLQAMSAQPIAVAAELANEQHYEVPAAFFQRVLGSRLKYSCCYWRNETASLDQAEDDALRITCERAQLEDGMDVLELGCGWGSLSLWMARVFPNSQITAVSNSQSQRKFIEQLAAPTGLTNLRVITANVNDFASEAAYDRVVSVEMFEHVRNHRKLMQRINGWLRPSGKLFVHIFCHKDTPYLFRSDGEHNWMGRHFFTGGVMPSADLLPRCCEPLTLAHHWIWSGTHYAKTCREWLARQDAAEHQLQETLAATYGPNHAHRWHHRWRLFFLACEELFACRGGSEWFVSHYLFERSNPLA